jgi:Protein of unknown function (DUF3558)
MRATPGGYRARVRAVLVVLTAVVALGLAGCGETVDTAKQTFPRSTVPAGQDGTETGSTGTPKTNDPALSNDKLRALDPCALLSNDILSAVGKPAENQVEDFGSCANYMENKDGKSLSVTIYVGETINNSDGAFENIGGLPGFVSELDDKTACFVNVITSTNPNLGIRVQIGGDEDDDLCGIGRTLLTAVIDLIREDPPERDEKTGSIANTDPCTLLEPAALKTVLGGADTESSPYTLHWCQWLGDNVDVGLWFRTGYDPKDSSTPGQPVDLGNGLTVYQTSEGDGSCRMEWRHRSTGVAGDDEIIEVDFDNSQAAAGDNGCATTGEIAKLVIPALPKP